MIEDEQGTMFTPTECRVLAVTISVAQHAREGARRPLDARDEMTVNELLRKCELGGR